MKIVKRILLVILSMIILSFLIPQNLEMPVENATKADYNPKTFWYYPWGKSGTHKGVDIFAKEGTRLNSATHGLVLWKGLNGDGGNSVIILGPKWRIHYYAHLKDISTNKYSFVKRGEKIGTVGSSGNAIGKPPHLHYAIITQVPYFWLKDDSVQGWKKMFLLDPTKFLQ